MSKKLYNFRHNIVRKLTDLINKRGAINERNNYISNK